MTSRLLISLSMLLLLAWQKAGAQLAPADDFFNSGAQFYISNNVPAALERVETGLTIYPDDEKLKKLEQLLKKQQQSQQQQNQSQQQKQDQQNKSDEQKNQQQNQHQDSQQPKRDEQKKASDDKGKDDSQEKQPGEPVKAGEMTPEEAKHLLDAQKGDEQLLQMKPQDKPRDPSRPVKDW